MKKALVLGSLSLILALSLVCLQEYSAGVVFGITGVGEQNIPLGGEDDDDVIDWLDNSVTSYPTEVV